ncbi:MAG: GIY-YIG nuclease family protein [Paenibacillus sp.]|nr:GIY-YIG nuclease family protein [Paenibacillus sp.]
MEKSKRKELSYNYVHSHREMGVYRILNIQNGKSFVGSAMNLNGVWNKHKFMLNMGGHMNKEFLAEWMKYGEDGFQYEILELIKPQEDFVLQASDLEKYKKILSDLEKKWFEQLSPYGERGYHKLK